MKKLKRFLCVFLSAAMIFLMPGVAYAVSDVANELVSQETLRKQTVSDFKTDISLQMPTEISVEQDLEKGYQSGILKPSALFNASANIATISETTAQMLRRILRR